MTNIDIWDIGVNAKEYSKTIIYNNFGKLFVFLTLRPTPHHTPIFLMLGLPTRLLLFWFQVSRNLFLYFY